MLKSRPARLLLAAVLVGATAGAAYSVHETHRQVETIAASGRAAGQRLARIEFLATELRNTMVTGDGAAPSAASLVRAAGLGRRVRSEIAQLGRLPVPVQALTGVAAAEVAAAEIATAVERATAYLDDGAELMAGDVLANDAARNVASLTAAVDRLQVERARAVAAATAPLTGRVTMLSAGAAAALLLGLIVLAVTSATSKRPGSEAASQAEPASAGARGGLGLAAPAAAARPATDLPRLADLCRDVAAAASPAELPSLLERTAGLLGAHGVILWAVADGHLVPVAAHGYTASALRAMGRVPMDHGTPLADACHSFRASAVTATEGAPAALIVPLGSAEACPGILTAECRGAEGFRADALAVARIAGSQFAAEFLWPGDAATTREPSDPEDPADPAADVPLDAASA